MSPNDDVQPFDLSALPPDVAAALTALLRAHQALSAIHPATFDGAQAASVAAVLALTGSQSGVTVARMLPVIEADGLWALGGDRSFPLWVARQHRVSTRTARAQVRLGRALRDDLPATATAAAAGQVALEQAQTMARLAATSDARRQVLANTEIECNEAFLVDEAQHLTVDHHAALVRNWAAMADPDADDRGYVEACEREHLELARLDDGYHLAGRLTVEHGECLATALEAVTPVPAADDERTSTQRRAQALADLARLGLDHGLVGTARAVRPRINVLVGYDTLTALVTAAAAAAETGAGKGRCPGSPLRH